MLRQCSFREAPLPVVLSAKSLGADISYCLGVAAKTRNGRVRSGGLRLVRRAGLPLGFHHRVAVVRKSIWKHTLHGCQTAQVPKTVHQKLRTKLCRGLRVDRSGRSPWLVANVLTSEPVDPEWAVLVERFRLCRQLARGTREWTSICNPLLQGHPGRYKGVTRRFVQQLHHLGWDYAGDYLFTDGWGRSFHVISSPWKHVCGPLKSTWMDKVVAQTCHRKGLSGLESIDTLNLRPWRGLSPAAAGLVRQSVTGVHFTADCRSHFGGDGACPLCGSPDSRDHRFLHCVGTADLRLKWNVQEVCDHFPGHAITYALFPELEDVRTLQAALDTIPLPVLQRQEVAVARHVFTDGSCLRPRFHELRISGGSVVVDFEGEFHNVWNGLVPGAQGIFRAELLAAGVAASLFSKCHIYSDCWSFVRKASRLLNRQALGLAVELPRSHRDLWEFFWNNATVVGTEICVQWTPAHRSLSTLEGHELWLAKGNASADSAARALLKHFGDSSGDYRKHVDRFFLREACAKRVLRYHHHEVALRCVYVTPARSESRGQSHDPVIWSLDEPEFLPPVAFAPDCICPEYVDRLQAFLREVQWSPTSGNGVLADTSLVELCMLCTRVTGCLPPVLCAGPWRIVGLDDIATVSDFDFKRLFCSWKRVFGGLIGDGLPFERVDHALSFGRLGIRLSGCGVSGRFTHPLACSQEFVDLCGSSPTLGGVRLPFL